ncbi:MAG: hypothetical protein ABJR23_03510 [Paracoccaceae bacterium]
MAKDQLEKTMEQERFGVFIRTIRKRNQRLLGWRTISSQIIYSRADKNQDNPKSEENNIITPKKPSQVVYSRADRNQDDPKNENKMK